MTEHALAAHSTKDASAQLLAPTDPIWRSIRDEALQAVDRDGATGGLFQALVLGQPSLEYALVGVLAARLGDTLWSSDDISALFLDVLETDEATLTHLHRDLLAVLDRDPACHRLIEPLLFFKGFHALQSYRFSHALWRAGRKDLALFVQSRASARFQVDIHPGTRIGAGLFLDHATGIVIGETAVIEDDVSVMQNVTLGGTGKDEGDRHPKVRRGVLVGAGAKVLGNIELGQFSRVAASSVVLDPVPECATVAGIPAKIVARDICTDDASMPSVRMDHTMPLQSIVDEGSGI
ncbi:MAG: serine O-acetyltransferase [Pseudomonadota bacterium]